MPLRTERGGEKRQGSVNGGEGAEGEEGEGGKISDGGGVGEGLRDGKK